MDLGYIAYCEGNWWFEGEAPSWRCAHTLVQLYTGIDKDTILSLHLDEVRTKWRLVLKPKDLSEVKWAIELIGPVPTSSESIHVLRRIDSILGTKHRIGPGPKCAFAVDPWADGLDVSFLR